MQATWVSLHKQELSIIALASKFSGYAPASFSMPVGLQAHDRCHKIPLAEGFGKV